MNHELTAAAPELSEHAQYLSDTHLLALLEMGLEATLYDQKAFDGRVGGPIDFLATWLMRHNPRHSNEGKALIERFATELGVREPLADVADLEERQQIEAAVKLQAAARGHTARMMTGEQKRSAKAATAMQAAERRRAARRELNELKAAEAAAAVVEAKAKAAEAAEAAAAAAEAERQVRSAPAGLTGGEEEFGGEDRAAAALQAGVRGRAVRKEREEQKMAATKVQAIHRGRADRSKLKEGEGEGEAAEAAEGGE